ncbi:uncharacterized protein BJ171DRAFT_173307 [Polychytrium aggregatum]|uniref:uncharacterized protein n=1 Tax=Polychytrium aggregatum TaxID=110093 RepID=UPI0022FE391A|nr:uncharacterized protein BJ171DRAFT_173307 [Polychytrium aggregatum]KAI9209013.1 hypothetical protein BJ171DRAFT_173307 [Polychytrium aggregatum]
MTTILDKISSLKDRALDAHQFSWAMELKALYDTATMASLEVARLEVSKQQAIDSDDYQAAHYIQDDIDLITDGLTSELRGRLSQLDSTTATASASMLSPPLLPLQADEGQAFIELEPHRPDPRNGREARESTDIGQSRSPAPMPPVTPELPKALSNSPIEPSLPGERDTSRHYGNQGREHMLTEMQKEELSMALEIYGEEQVSNLVSKKFALRESALQYASQHLEDIFKRYAELDQRAAPSRGLVSKQPKQLETTIGATFQFVQVGIRDSRERSLLLTLSLLEQLTRICDSLGVSTGYSFKFVEKLIPTLLIKCADMNPRIQHACSDLMMSLGAAYRQGSSSIMPQLMRPFQGKVSLWRVVKSRLDLVRRMLLEFGLGSTSDSASGLELQAIMGLVVPQLHNPNVEVRESAVKLMAEIIAIVGAEVVDPFLSSIKPQLLRSIKLKAEAAAGSLSLSGVTPPMPWTEDSKTQTTNSQLLVGSVEPKEHIQQQSPEPAAKEELGAIDRTEPSKLAEGNYNAKSWPANDNSITSKSEVAGTPSTRNIHLHPQETPVQATAGPFVNEAGPDESFSDRCIFCEEYDPSEQAGGLEAHYWRDCPMLFICNHCSELVEISELGEHHLRYCQRKQDFQVCAKCKQVILSSHLPLHLASDRCHAPQSINEAGCPLCFKLLPNTELAWRAHLACCTKNARARTGPQPDKQPLSPYRWIVNALYSFLDSIWLIGNNMIARAPMYSATWL